MRFNLTLQPCPLNIIVLLCESLLRVIFNLVSLSLRSIRISQVLDFFVHEARIIVFGRREHSIHVGIPLHPKAQFMPWCNRHRVLVWHLTGSSAENLVGDIDHGAYPDFLVHEDLCNFLLLHVPEYTYHASQILDCPTGFF
jgi:hypothetical protein